MTTTREGTSPVRPDAPIVIQSHALGALQIESADIRTFPHGLIGFPECHRFALLAVAERTGMFWLQSVEHPALAFLLVDPFLVSEGYAVDLSDIDRYDLSAHDPADVMVLVVVTLSHAPGAPCTANFQGPIAFNLRAGIGKQLVLAEAPLGVRTPVDLDRCGREAGTDR
jgi:flagellar assembly factor FliW